MSNNKKLPKQFQDFFDRKESLKKTIFKENINEIELEKHLALGQIGERDLYNYFYSLLTLGTLFLRYGSVILLNHYMQNYLEFEHDNKLNKNILRSLKGKLPSDGDWQGLWIECSRVLQREEYLVKALATKNTIDVVGKFTKNRNRVVDTISKHDSIYNLLKTKKDGYVKSILLCIIELANIANQINLFSGYTLSKSEKGYILNGEKDSIEIKYFVATTNHSKQETQENTPYLFHGIASWEKQSKYLGTVFGDIHSSTDLLEKDFHIIEEKTSENIFEFDELLENYRGCFVGREEESNLLYNFAKGNSDKNITAVFAPAGMGKSALTGNLIDRLNKDNNKVLYHFCGSGDRNNPLNIIGAILHQKKKEGIWKDISPSLQKKINSLPPKWEILRDIFQDTLIEWSNIVSKQLEPKYTDSKLLVICEDDAVDDALNAGAEYAGNEVYFEKIKSGWDEFDVIITTSEFMKKMGSLGRYIKAKSPSSTSTIVKDVTGCVKDIRNGEFSSGKPQFLTIIIDAVDESVVAHANPPITDLFYRKSEGEKHAEVWDIPKYVKFVITYRKQTKNNRDYGPGNRYIQIIDCLQPVMPLSEDAVNIALDKLKETHEILVTNNVKQKIIEYGAVQY